MTLYKWSQTAASDATADSTINWAEGQAPSSVNDSARAMMAATAKYRDDIAGAIVTGGTSTAYTVSSYEVFDSLAHLGGQMIAFTPHIANSATVTLNVDALGAKPLRSAPGVELLGGTIIQGTPYVAVYNNSDGAFYLQGCFGNPYNIPLGGAMPFFLSIAPNSSFVFPYGQAVSRSAYSALFSAMGTTYGSGDGSTTFNVPDLRGRVPAGLDNMGGSGASRLTAAGGGVDGATLGAVGGAQNAPISQANLPAVSLVTTISDPGHGHPGSTGQIQGTANSGQSTATALQGGNNTGALATQSLNIATNATGITASTALGGSGTAFRLVQPTIAVNYIMRVI
jgi:microcystin-dependent protein